MSSILDVRSLYSFFTVPVYAYNFFYKVIFVCPVRRKLYNLPKRIQTAYKEDSF
ncbi:unnamed protein product [Larinioides sclopetarius]|uniref:Uncharacterized protein n=1 Tax=Larinioides sclopetarius TaxID=280406 RepID=A0AAV1ZQX3_9ARAC